MTPLARALIAGRRRTYPVRPSVLWEWPCRLPIGDLGAVTGVLLYRPAFSVHRFRGPHIIAIGYLTFSIVVASALWYSMASEDRRRARIIADGKSEEVDRETKVLLGDREVH